MTLYELFFNSKKVNKNLIKKLRKIDYHMNLFKCDIDYLKTKIPDLYNMTDDEIIIYMINIIKKCDASNQEYDSKLDEEMIRIGLETNNYYSESIFSDDYLNDINSMYDNDEYESVKYGRRR